jgi:hypothetical protein
MGLFDFLKAAPKELPAPEPLHQEAMGAPYVPPYLDELLKGNKEIPEAAFVTDPYQASESMGYRERTSALGFDTCRQIVAQNTIIGSIIQTVLNCSMAFMQRQPDRYSAGFRVVMSDKDAKPSNKDKIRMREIEDFVLMCGTEENSEHRDDFPTFARQILWDGLVFDQMCWERVYDRKGRLSSFYAVDATTIRIAGSNKPQKNSQEKRSYKQLIDGQVVNEFSAEELTFSVMNKRTDYRSNGYGTSNLELGLSAVCNLAEALKYNAQYFRQGATAPGVLNIQGNVSESSLNQFKRAWKAQVTGIKGAWKTPVMASEGLQFIKLNGAPKDLEFGQWIQNLVQTICALYGLSPSSINFNYGSMGVTSQLNEASSTDKIMEAKDRGLRPWLKHVEHSLNRSLIWKLGDERKYSLRFVGLDALGIKESNAISQSRAQYLQTVDELRALEDLPPLPDDQGKVILNGPWMQTFHGKDEGGAERPSEATADPKPGPKKQATFDTTEENEKKLDQRINDAGELFDDAKKSLVKGQDGYSPVSLEWGTNDN